MDDCLGECLARFIFQCVWALTVVKLGKHIASHQDLIIRRVLRLQDLLRLPKCVHVFSEDDHETPEIDFKISAGLLVWCLILSAIVIAGTLLGGRSWCGMALRLVLLLVAVSSPFCILLWIIPAVSARHRANHRSRVARPCQETNADGGMGKPASRLTPEQQPLRWGPEELSLPFF